MLGKVGDVPFAENVRFQNCSKSVIFTVKLPVQLKLVPGAAWLVLGHVSGPSCELFSPMSFKITLPL